MNYVSNYEETHFLFCCTKKAETPDISLTFLQFLWSCQRYIDMTQNFQRWKTLTQNLRFFEIFCVFCWLREYVRDCWGTLYSLTPFVPKYSWKHPFWKMPLASRSMIFSHTKIHHYYCKCYNKFLTCRFHWHIVHLGRHIKAHFKCNEIEENKFVHRTVYFQIEIIE